MYLCFVKLILKITNEFCGLRLQVPMQQIFLINFMFVIYEILLNREAICASLSVLYNMRYKKKKIMDFIGYQPMKSCLYRTITKHINIL